MSARIARNANLDRTAGVQPFLRIGEPSSLPALTASLDAPSPIDIGGSRKPLAAHMQASIGLLLDRAVTGQPFHLYASYNQTSLMPDIPIGSFDLNVPQDRASLVDALTAEVERFLTSYDIHDGVLMFDVRFLPSELAVTTPLLRARLTLPMTDVER